MLLGAGLLFPDTFCSSCNLVPTHVSQGNAMLVVAVCVGADAGPSFPGNADSLYGSVPAEVQHGVPSEP